MIKYVDESESKNTKERKEQRTTITSALMREMKNTIGCITSASMGLLSLLFLLLSLFFLALSGTATARPYTDAAVRRGSSSSLSSDFGVSNSSITVHKRKRNQRGERSLHKIKLLFARCSYHASASACLVYLSHQYNGLWHRKF